MAWQDTASFIGAGNQHLGPVKTVHIDSEGSVPNLPSGMAYTVGNDPNQQEPSLCCPVCGQVTTDSLLKTVNLPIPSRFASEAIFHVGKTRCRLEPCGHEVHYIAAGSIQAERESRRLLCTPKAPVTNTVTIACTKQAYETAAKRLYVLLDGDITDEERDQLQRWLALISHQLMLLSGQKTTVAFDDTAFVAQVQEAQFSDPGGGYSTDYPMPVLGGSPPPNLNAALQTAMFGAKKVIPVSPAMTTTKGLQGTPFPTKDSPQLAQIQTAQTALDAAMSQLNSMPPGPERNALSQKADALHAMMQNLLNQAAGYIPTLPPIKDPTPVQVTSWPVAAIDNVCERKPGPLVQWNDEQQCPEFDTRVLDALLLLAEKYPNNFTILAQTCIGSKAVSKAALEQLKLDIIDRKEGRKTHGEVWEHPVMLGEMLSATGLILCGLMPDTGSARSRLLAVFTQQGKHIILCRYQGGKLVTTMERKTAVQEGPTPAAAGKDLKTKADFHKRFRRRKRIIRKLDEE